MDRLEQLQQFYEEDPADPFTRFALAREHLKQGRAEEALAHFEGLVQEHPNYTGVYYHLGKLYERLGRRKDAVATYEQGVERARSEHAQKDLSELQDALLAARGVGFD